MVNDHKIKVGLVQINNGFSGQSYFPYSIGVLQAYSQKFLKDASVYEFLLPVYQKCPVDQAVNHLLDTDIVAFSVYAWNVKLSLEIASNLKKQNPQIIVLFGGPQVPSLRTEKFLKENPFIDLACIGEGEIAFKEVLENYPGGDFSSVPSICYKDKNGQFHKNLAQEVDFNSIPSPYLEGVFDPLIKADNDHQWLGLWETNRGCPFSCSYCDWGDSKKNKVRASDINRLYREIDWFSDNKIEFIFCCDANFCLLKRDKLIVDYMVANKEKCGYPKAFSVQSTKNFTEDTFGIHERMSKAGLSKGVSLSLQSLNPATLKETKRKNITIDDFQKIQKRLTIYGVETFTDLILPLPEETYDTFADGVSKVIGNGQHNRVQFNNLSILPNAEMGRDNYQRRFGFQIIENDLVNIHGSLSEKIQIRETQHLVVGTSSMPKDQWVRARVFAWMTALLHFDKLLQIPLITLHHLSGLSYRVILERFTESENIPDLFAKIKGFFAQKALDIQNGLPEYCESEEWLNILWPADEFVFIRISTENRLD
ncbi:radical SAM protein, partial [Candidatus Pacearchaeota archaeon]|nr:radical SAM protein [Candidatus Pacearchaeota archaeon]